MERMAIMENKIIKLRQLNKIKKLGKTVFVSGAFDLMHYGHYKALKKASKFGDTLVVQIDGNKLVSKRKGPKRPILHETFRAIQVSYFDFVDYVFVSNTPSESSDTLRLVNPDVYVRAMLNEETAAERSARELKLQKKNENMKVVWLRQSKEVSTTKILAIGNAKHRSQVLASFK